jgi:serine/threonine protein kinase
MKLADFGLSRIIDYEEKMTGKIGTVAWMAPEVLQCKKYSAKADCYR